MALFFRKLLFEAGRKKKPSFCVQSSFVFAQKSYHYQGIESIFHKFPQNNTFLHLFPNFFYFSFFHVYFWPVTLTSKGFQRF